MPRAHVEAPATHFRLKPETWAIIAEEYRNGATARDIGAKWKVAPSSVYRYACRDGWTKKGMGDARARAHARMVEEEEAAHRSVNPVGSRALKGLFSPAPADDAGATDPAALARAATLASGRAMKGRLWAEARALAGLAETYGRLAEREARATGAGLTLDTVDLKLVYDILVDEEGRLAERMALGDDGPETPHYEVRRAFHRRLRAARGVFLDEIAREQDRSRRLEDQVRDLGGEPPPGQDDPAAETPARVALDRLDRWSASIYST